MSETATPRPEGGIRRVLAERDFRVYFAGSSLSVLGFWVQRLAIQAVTWNLTHSHFWLGIMALADVAAVLVLGPVAGVVTDRMDRFRLLRITQTLAAILATVLAVLTYAGAIDRWILLALVLAGGTVMTFNMPAQMSAIPRLVSRRNLASALGLNGSMVTTSIFLGPMVAGLLIEFGGGAGAAFLFNAVTYGVFLIALMALRVTPQPPRMPDATTSVRREAMAGLRYIIHHPGIGPVFLLMVMAGVLMRPVGELLAGVAGDIFGNESYLFWLATAQGGGAMVGGLLLAQRGRTAGLTQRVLLAILVSTVAVFGLSIAPVLWVALALLFASGVATATYIIGSITLVQSAVDDAMRGRVMSFWGMTMRAAPALGAFVVGRIADGVGLRWPIAIAALLSLSVWLYAMARRRRLAAILESEPAPAGKA
ncbi:MAG: MFS transporter [Alphaproteobacteria bacterium]